MNGSFKNIAPSSIFNPLFSFHCEKSIPIVLNFLNLFAKSILVPTPSVQDTITGSFILMLLKSKREPKPPMLSFYSIS